MRMKGKYQRKLNGRVIIFWLLGNVMLGIIFLSAWGCFMTCQYIKYDYLFYVCVYPTESQQCGVLGFVM
jgi:hypothetical protein